MDILQAILNRRSIRGFTNDPVSPQVVRDILEAALRAPSAMNCQPWELTVLTGEPLEAIKSAFQEKVRAGEEGRPDRSLEAYWPKDSIYRQRQVDLAKRLFSLLGIERGDKAARQSWLERGFRFFEAPVVIIVSLDSSLGQEGPLLDVGALLQTICLAALAYGLGTCIQNQGVTYPDILRRHAGIKEGKRIVTAISLGYPDWDDPVNTLAAPRESLESVTSWVGFD